MKESNIRKPEDLDAALAGNAMHKREKLWRAAEGRPYRWPDIVGIILGVFIIFGSLYEGYIEKADVAFQLFLGMAAIGSAVLRHQQSQISALLELLKQNEREPR